jgi:hypothetical protein
MCSITSFTRTDFLSFIFKKKEKNDPRLAASLMTIVTPPSRSRKICARKVFLHARERIALSRKYTHVLFERRNNHNHQHESNSFKIFLIFVPSNVVGGICARKLRPTTVPWPSNTTQACFLTITRPKRYFGASPTPSKRKE